MSGNSPREAILCSHGTEKKTQPVSPGVLVNLGAMKVKKKKKKMQVGERFTLRVKAASTSNDRSKVSVPGYPSLCCFLPGPHPEVSRLDMHCQW